MREHHRGLIALSACLQGKVPGLLMAGRREKAREAAEELAQIFGENNFFLELQDAGLPEQKKVNPGSRELAAELGLGLVATNDCHYLKREHFEAHDALICLQTGKTLSDADRLKLSPELYVKSPQEMAELFPEDGEAVARTVEIARRCEFPLPWASCASPSTRCPRARTPTRYWPSGPGRGSRPASSSSPAWGFPSTKRSMTSAWTTSWTCCARWASPLLPGGRGLHQLGQGPGHPGGTRRGSAAGSLVAYAIRITDLDPLRYKLIFERFLNLERKSMPTWTWTSAWTAAGRCWST